MTPPNTAADIAPSRSPILKVMLRSLAACPSIIAMHVPSGDRAKYRPVSPSGRRRPRVNHEIGGAGYETGALDPCAEVSGSGRGRPGGSPQGPHRPRTWGPERGGRAAPWHVGCD